MSEQNTTSVFYRAVANFSDIRKELASYRRSLAATKAAEASFNNSGTKNRNAATKASKDRTKALTAESAALKTATARVKAYAAALTPATVATRAATKAIQNQNLALLTNAKRLRSAALAAKKYQESQSKISSNGGSAITSTTRALGKEKKALVEATDAREQHKRAIREESQALVRAEAASVRFVDGVGKVNQATGEVVETTDRAIKKNNAFAESLAKAKTWLGNYGIASRQATREQEILSNARQRHEEATTKVRQAELRLAEAIKKTGQDSARTISAELSLANAKRLLAKTTHSVEAAERSLQDSNKKTVSSMRSVEIGSQRVLRGLKRFGDWRPRLVPPFVALVPLIGAVIAALNPLVALIGTLSPLVVGLAGNIGSLAGAFLALPGILSGVVAGIGSVIASMGGVGNVFKTYSAMQKATSGGGKTQAERAEALADAEYDLARAQKNVRKAQEGLNKAREEALQDLIDLRVEVSRASIDEERAIANLRLAQEAYWNVMADPGSTLGDKLDAAAAIKEAENDLQDVRAKNIENQKKLNQAEKDGVENSERVLEAQDQLTEAYRSQQKAQRALNDDQSGGSGAVSSVNAFNEALAKLSPSAQKFVLALLAMQDQWKSFRSEMQETFFSQFVEDLDRLPRLLNSLTSFLRPASAAMGSFVSKTLTMLDTPAWSRDLATIGEQNGKVITDLGDGFLALATALKDVVVAAGPFTEWMTNGFARGSENFSKFIADARETASLASWLEKVEVRLRRWWDIVKNISATLFNYSSAASDFGDWLSDGFLKTTENWRKASEAARLEDSPFKKYLEDVKPLLRELKGLFGDFFGWFREEMMSPDNIKSAENLVKLLRNDLGPAVRNLMDSLSATNIDEKLVQAIASIVRSLDTLISNGGGKSFEAFFDVVTGFFSTLSNIIAAFPKDVLEWILGAFGTLAAISFVGKFSGLTWLLGALPSAVTNVKTMFGWFQKLGGLKFVGLVGLLTALASLPEILKTGTDLLNGIAGIDTSSLEKAANIAATSRGALGAHTVKDTMSSNTFNQARNWVFDAGRNTNAGEMAWQKVDDQLRDILKSGDLEAFREAWKKLEDTVGSKTARQMWTLVYEDANRSGAALGGTAEKVRDLGSASRDADARIADLKAEIGGLGSGAKTESQAVDDLAASIDNLNKFQGVTKDNFAGQSAEAREFRAMLRGVDTDARTASQAILDNGGSVEEARAKYEEGRKAIEDYLTKLGVPPEEARRWADAQLGPMDEVLKKFKGIKDEMSRKETINKELAFQLNTKFFGGSGEQLPMITLPDGRQVVDFFAMGKAGGIGQNKDPKGAGSLGGGGGGGLSVGLTFGLKEQVTKETTESKSIWDSFWSGLPGSMVGPLASVVAQFSAMQSGVKSQGLDPLARNTKASTADIQTNALDPLKSALSTVQTTFNVVTAGIGSVWAGLKEKFADPVNFVINTVYNDGIRSFWNTINDTLGLKLALPKIAPLKYADGGVLPGYTPGRDVHSFSSPTGGNLELSGGEAIMRPEWTRAVGGPKEVARMNKEARAGKFASGGVYSPRDRYTPKADSSDSEDGSPLSWIAGFFGDPLKFVRDGLTSAVGSLLGNIAGGTYGQLLAAMPKTIIDNLGKTAKDKAPQNTASANGFTGGKTLARVLSVLPPNLQITSTYRTPQEDLAVGGTGRTRHTRKDDPAVDIAGSVGAMNAFAKTLANMGGWYQVLYNNISYPGVTYWPGHSNHVHAAMKNGGVWNAPGLYDNGGWLQHGQMGINLTGKPEAVLDPMESRALKALLSGGGLPGLAPLGATPGLNVPGQGAQKIVDNSVNIGEFKVVNPVPETASESLPKAIRRTAYVNSARSDS